MQKSAKTVVVPECPICGEPCGRLKNWQTKFYKTCCKPECRGKLIAFSKTRDKKTFTDKANKVHDNRYTYNNSEYKCGLSSVQITCDKHGDFPQTPQDHLAGAGCPKCAREIIDISKIVSEEDFIKRADIIHKGIYTYEQYTKASNPVLVNCPNPEHKPKWQQASSHLAGHGCSDCAKSGFNFSKPSTLYYIKDITCGLYKIGITNLSLKKRFGPKMKDIEVLETWSFELGVDAYDLEQFLHEEFNSYQELNENFSDIGGKTEFFNKDVLNRDN